MGRRFVWFASVAFLSAVGGALPLRAQPPSVIYGDDRRRDDDRLCEDGRRRDDVYCDDRRREGDRVYRDRHYERDDELRQPGRNGRGAENGRGKKNGLRKRNPGNSSRYPDNRYPDTRYPDNRYPDTRYPDNRNPDNRNPDDGYPDNRYPNTGDLGVYRTLNVDRQYYPQNGECRVWFANRQPRLQLPSMDCDQLYGRVPAGSFILYNYRAWDADFDWARYEERYRGSVPSVIVQLSESMRR
jgi:hypothetical protein